MKKYLLFIIMFLLSVCTIASAEMGKGGTGCKQCAMSLSPLAHSRMVIEYGDGSAVEVCSLQCAVDYIQQHKDVQVKSLKVADYATKELIDAGSATWVIGGTVPGVMTALPKWAFARESDAQKFVSEKGGQVATFEETRKKAEEKSAPGATGAAHEHHKHGSHDMGPGSQMLFNPAFGDQMYHTHPEGMWMVNYKFMHMDMRGLRSGTSNVGLDSVGYMRKKPYEYMMIPTSMTMDMHMVMAMYGITDRLTVMGMANYTINEMKMVMDMGPKKPITDEAPMRTSGFSDTEIRGMYKINKYLVGSLGLSIPTGSIKQTVAMMGKEYRAPYDMQLGSGTWDIKPAITYNGLSDDALWNWGAQAMYTIHPGKNTNDYSLGNNFKLMSWLQRALGPATTWLRFSFSDTGRIRGKDSEIDLMNHPVTGMGAPTPDADPANYGGQRIDGFLGASFNKGPFSFGVEGGLPLYQRLNGLQMKTDWFISASFQVMF